MPTNIDIATKQDLSTKQNTIDSNLASFDIDNTRGNWVTALNNEIIGTGPFGKGSAHWVNLLQMDSTHFQSQIGLWINQGSKGPDGLPLPPTEIFIRSKYCNDKSFSPWVPISAQSLHIKYIVSDEDLSSTDYSTNLKKIVSKITIGLGLKFYTDQTSQYPNLHRSLVKKLNDDGFTNVTITEALEIKVEAPTHVKHPFIFDMVQNQQYKCYRFIVDMLGDEVRISKTKCIYDGN